MKKTCGSLLSPSFSRWRSGHHCPSISSKHKHPRPGARSPSSHTETQKRNPRSAALMSTESLLDQGTNLSLRGPVEDTPRGACGLSLQCLGSCVSNSNSVSSHAFHPCLAHPINRRTKNIHPYRLIHLPTVHTHQ